MSPGLEHGYLRDDGRKGIRNYVLVVYLVECARHVSERIMRHFDDNDRVQLIGWSGCYSNDSGYAMLRALLSHPNIGAALLVSLGCEGMNRHRLRTEIAATGRWVETLEIQEAGGTLRSIEKGIALLETGIRNTLAVPRAAVNGCDLVVGLICGGSDATSGITANPAIGRAVDQLLDSGGTGLFEETCEMVGCEAIIRARGATPALGEELACSIEKAKRFYEALGQASISSGNADGELTTIEEKSMGAYCKTGSRPIRGILPPGRVAAKPGLYLVDVVSEDAPHFGFATVNDNDGIMSLISCGAHLILFSTGRGTVVGSAVSPVIKVCSNPETYRRMRDDMDVNAGAILSGVKSLDAVGREILDMIERVVQGRKTASEALGHCEYTLSYRGELTQGCALQ